MNGHQVDDRATWFKSSLVRLGLTFLGIFTFVAIAIGLESEVGIPFATTFRVACAAICLGFIWSLGRDFPRERWPRISLWVALLVNIVIFWTPLVNRPASRGELMLFALPDAIIVLVILLAERIVTYPAVDDHQRAIRQQIILGLVLAVAICAILFTLVLLAPRTRR
jgi:Na+-translocating ferredoxin:NAD+ oxidoreductase RnfA subunit